MNRPLALVAPDGTADIVLLVHFLKMGGAAGTTEAAASCEHGDHATHEHGKK